MILLDSSALVAALYVDQRNHPQCLLNIGVAEASIVVLANRYVCGDIATLDERHFRPLRVRGKNFRILPADA